MNSIEFLRRHECWDVSSTYALLSVWPWNVYGHEEPRKAFPVPTTACRDSCYAPPPGERSRRRSAGYMLFTLLVAPDAADFMQ